MYAMCDREQDALLAPGVGDFPWVVGEDQLLDIELKQYSLSEYSPL